MKIFKENEKTYPGDVTKTFDFQRFCDQCGDFTLIKGYLDFRGLESLKGEKIVHIENEDPNRFLSNNPLFNHINYEDYLYKVFTICPYTASWLNQKYNNNKRTFTFIPFNENLIPPKTEKIYDIIYSGHILSKELENNIKIISKFNYRLIAPQTEKLSTNPNSDYKTKLLLTSQSKISLVHNMLFVNENQIQNLYKNFPDFKKNIAFRKIPKNNFFYKILGKIKPRIAFVPQVKQRLFEAAFCKSLILCRRDDFNIIEKFFIPEKEFIYYDSGHLKESIENILSNYGEYQDIIENAYQKAITNYTTRNFFERFLKNI